MGVMLVVRILLALLGTVFVSVGLLLWSIPAGLFGSGVLMVLVAYVWQYMAVGNSE